MMYVDFPFCYKVCEFCKCNPIQYTTHSLRYLTAINSVIRDFKDVLSDFVLDEVWFGGGTPMLIPVKEFRSLLDEIPNFSRIGIKSIEGHPRLLSDEWVELIIEYGFNYVNLGVQTFDAQLLLKVNRDGFNYEELKVKIHRLKSHGITVNLDLIVYLDGITTESLKRFRRDLDLAYDLHPSMVYCYFDKRKINPKHTNYNAIRRYRSEMLKFCRLRGSKLVIDAHTLLSEEHIKSHPEFTSPILLDDNCTFPQYSSNTLDCVDTTQISLGIGGVEGHEVYGHIGDEYHYYMKMSNLNKFITREVTHG